MPDQSRPEDSDVTLHHVALYISDLDRTRRFYQDVLGMKEIARPADFTFPGAYFRLGTAEIHVVVETEPGRTEKLRQQWLAEAQDRLHRAFRAGPKRSWTDTCTTRPERGPDRRWPPHPGG